MRPKVLDTLRDPGPETLYSISTTKKRFFFLWIYCYYCHLIALKTVYTAGSVANGTVFSLAARVRFISNETKNQNKTFDFSCFSLEKQTKAKQNPIRKESRKNSSWGNSTVAFPAVFPSNFHNFRFDRHSTKEWDCLNEFDKSITLTFMSLMICWKRLPSAELSRSRLRSIFTVKCSGISTQNYQYRLFVFVFFVNLLAFFHFLSFKKLICFRVSSSFYSLRSYRQHL